MNKLVIKDIPYKHLSLLKSERESLRPFKKQLTKDCKLRYDYIDQHIKYTEQLLRIEQWLMVDTPIKIYEMYEELKDIYHETTSRYPTNNEEKRIIFIQDAIRPYTLYTHLFNDSIWSAEYRIKREHYILAPQEQVLRDTYKKTKQYPTEWLVM